MMRENGIGGDVLAWRDVLHEGPVPAHLSLDELSDVRANYLAHEGAGELENVRRDFAARDDILRRFTDYDEVVLWFEWDLYDQLQLIQLLDFFAACSERESAETRTPLSVVSFAGYLGSLRADAFPDLMKAREPVTKEMLVLGRKAWDAFRDSNPRSVECVQAGDTGALPFLGAALRRELEEYPSTSNGLSRSELQILEALADRPQNFTEIFARVSDREDRVFCGDFTLAGYIERMSNCDSSLITLQSGDRVSAPRSADDSRPFGNAELVLTELGRQVVACDADWIALGGSDRWLGGVHLVGGSAQWRWDSDTSMLRETRMDATT